MIECINQCKIPRIFHGKIRFSDLLASWKLQRLGSHRFPGQLHRKWKSDLKWSPIRNTPRWTSVLSPESRSVPRKVVVTAQVRAERTRVAPTTRRRPETEIGRPEVEIASPEMASSSHVAIVSSHSQSVNEGGISIEPLSGYPFPARQKPEIVWEPVPHYKSFNSV